MLKKSDIVEIVSLGTASSFKEIQNIKNFIENLELKPRVFFEETLSLKKPESHEFPSFLPKKRFEQLKKAIESSDSKLIWCSAGGYGTAEILPFLEKLKKPRIKKTIIGFSDISSLNSFFIEKWGWQVITAPMLAQIARKQVSAKSIKAITDLIFGKKTQFKYKLENLTPAKKTIHALINGGCISVLAGQFGTKNQINWHNKILFLEDEGETGERLDRYFSQIITIMQEQKKYPKAILLGNFLQANPHGTPKAKNIKTAIARFAQKIKDQKIPTILFKEKTNCLGHSKKMLPLILGIETEIKKDKGAWHLSNLAPL